MRCWFFLFWVRSVVRLGVAVGIDELGLFLALACLHVGATYVGGRWVDCIRVSVGFWGLGGWRMVLLCVRWFYGEVGQALF